MSVSGILTSIQFDCLDYGGYGNNGNNSGDYAQSSAPNFSVPPPAPFQSGPGQNYPPPQQGGNWGPPGGRDNSNSSSGGYGSSYQGRQNSRGGNSYGSNPRKLFQSNKSIENVLIEKKNLNHM